MDGCLTNCVESCVPAGIESSSFCELQPFGIEKNVTKKAREKDVKLK